jgi:hypothetical protein
MTIITERDREKNTVSFDHETYYVDGSLEYRLFYIEQVGQPLGGGYKKNTRKVRKYKRKSRKTNRRKSMKR